MIFTHLVEQFKIAVPVWHEALTFYGSWVFFTLATLNTIWLGIVIVLHRRGHLGFGALMGHIIQTGWSLTLWTKGDEWIPAIIASFEQIGRRASGTQKLDPSSIIDKAIATCLNMFATLGFWGTLSHPATGFAVSFDALIAFIAMALVAGHMVYVLARTQIIIGFAPLMLAFGGSRWTIHITEKYLSHVLSTGALLLALYCMIGIADPLTQGWAADLKLRGGTDTSVFLEVIMGALLYAVLCWLTPTWVAEMFSGAIGMTMTEIERSAAMVYARVPGGGSSSGSNFTPSGPSSPLTGGGGTPSVPTTPTQAGATALKAAWDSAAAGQNGSGQGSSSGNTPLLNQFRNAGSKPVQSGQTQQSSNLSNVSNPVLKAQLTKWQNRGKP